MIYIETETSIEDAEILSQNLDPLQNSSFNETELSSYSRSVHSMSSIFEVRNI